MTTTKQSSIESKQYFDEHKQTTRSKMNEIKSNKSISENNKKRMIELLLDDVREKQGTEDFKKHAEVRRADYKKIRELVIERVVDAKKVKKADIQEAVDFFYCKTEKKDFGPVKESKETMKKPQLESENHKIDKGLSKEEKLAQGRKEEERTAYIYGNETKIKVLQKELAPGAFVREYQDDRKIPTYHVGEQLFNKAAVTYLDLWKKLPTWENIVAMRGETNEENENFLKNNFQKHGRNIFPGCYVPGKGRFLRVGDNADFWLSDGVGVGLGRADMGCHGDTPEFGFSLRFLKN